MGRITGDLHPYLLTPNLIYSEISWRSKGFGIAVIFIKKMAWVSSNLRDRVYKTQIFSMEVYWREHTEAHSTTV